MSVDVQNPSTGGTAVAPQGGVIATNPATSGSVTPPSGGATVPTSNFPGPPGKSAYEIAVEAGFVGTEDEWVDSLEGDPGPQGEAGLPGPQGDPGAGSYYAEFSFASPTTVWTFSHNQNSYGVTVETVDLNGDPIEGYVRPLDENTVEVNWYYPTAGTARVFR